MAEEKKENTAKIDQAKQEKLKKETEKQNKDDELKSKSSAELRALLSNKNSDYVFRLQKELQNQGQMSADDAKAKVDPMLAEIVIAQHHGQPANGLYMASPKIKAQEMLHPKQKPKGLLDIPFWQRATDTTLLWLAIIFVMDGLLAVFNTKVQSGQNGLLTIVVMGIILGLFMAKYNEWALPKYDANGNRQKMSWGKIIGISVLMIVVVIAGIGILTRPFLKVINPVLPGIVYLILGAALFGARYLFRKYYHITISAFAPSENVSRNK